MSPVRKPASLRRCITDPHEAFWAGKLDLAVVSRLVPTPSARVTIAFKWRSYPRHLDLVPMLDVCDGDFFGEILARTLRSAPILLWIGSRAASHQCQGHCVTCIVGLLFHLSLLFPLVSPPGPPYCSWSACRVLLSEDGLQNSCARPFLRLQLWRGLSLTKMPCSLPSSLYFTLTPDHGVGSTYVANW